MDGQLHTTNAPTTTMTVILMCLEPPGSQTPAKHIVYGGERHICSAVSAAEPE